MIRVNQTSRSPPARSRREPSIADKVRATKLEKETAMANTLNLSLTDELRAFVDANCGEGTLYATPSEFVRDLLRQRKQQLEAAAARDAIVAGYQDAVAGLPTRRHLFPAVTHHLGHTLALKQRAATMALGQANEPGRQAGPPPLRRAAIRLAIHGWLRLSMKGVAHICFQCRISRPWMLALCSISERRGNCGVYVDWRIVVDCAFVAWSMECRGLLISPRASQGLPAMEAGVFNGRA